MRVLSCVCARVLRLRYQLADRCDVTIVGRMFQYVNNAVGFGLGVSQRFIEDYNQVRACVAS